MRGGALAVLMAMVVHDCGFVVLNPPRSTKDNFLSFLLVLRRLFSPFFLSRSLSFSYRGFMKGSPNMSRSEPPPNEEPLFWHLMAFNSQSL